MTPARLLSHFDRLADAPDAVPRLRRFVLDLAVRGKLVPQDPADETATEQLKRIAAKKNQPGTKVSQKRIALFKGGEDQCPYPLPLGWVLLPYGVSACR